MTINASCRDGAMVRALAFHQRGPGFHSQTRRHMWVEFVGSLLCSERFPPGTLASPLLENQHLIGFPLIVNFSLQCPQLVLHR